MEMRLLTTEGERHVFAQRLADARARHGASYRDIGRSQARNINRLAAADLYGLFETERDYAENMTAGVALHDLAIYPQSCQQPDLSHYAPQSVLECSDHWSLSRGAGMRAWRGIAVQVVRRDPRAVLVYLAVGTHDGFYTAMGFVNAGDPVEYPYLEEPDQGSPRVQPKILAGEALAKLTANVRRLKIDTPDDYLTIRFDNSDRLRPAADRYPLRVGEIPAPMHV
ncbi:MAG TPA: hypothetical protein VN865_06850 [Candidatus Acidoferrales bacterium]|jgi:hypothetical protein|nr:hypothetical protein [Candidatus Acidoferrales bacterium]